MRQVRGLSLSDLHFGSVSTWRPRYCSFELLLKASTIAFSHSAGNVHPGSYSGWMQVFSVPTLALRANPGKCCACFIGLTTHSVLCLQIAYNAEQKRIQELEKNRTIQSGDDAEAAYQARIRNAAQYEPPSYFGRPKVQWFY